MVQKTKFSGFRELEAALAELPKATGKNVLRRILKQAAQPIADDAAANAPRLSGRLSGDVKTGTRLTKRQAAMVRKMGKSEAEIHVGVSDPAGIQTEFGNEHQAAEPWLRPSWDANQDGALNTIKDNLGPEIEKAAARLAKKAARAAK